jgi:hypothetical protein
VYHSKNSAFTFGDGSQRMPERRVCGIWIDSEWRLQDPRNPLRIDVPFQEHRRCMRGQRPPSRGHREPLSGFRTAVARRIAHGDWGTIEPSPGRARRTSSSRRHCPRLAPVQGRRHAGFVGNSKSTVLRRCSLCNVGEALRWRPSSCACRQEAASRRGRRRWPSRGRSCPATRRLQNPAWRGSSRSTGSTPRWPASPSWSR